MSGTRAELILRNGKVFTVDDANLWGEAVACAGGRILAVGKYEQMVNLVDDHTKVVDVGGRLVLPGLADAHVHMLWYALQKRQNQVDLYGINDFPVVRERLRQAVEKTPPGQWVHGWGWDESSWDVHPALSLLDEVAANTPVAIRRKDLHTWWVNSAALRLAGITREMPDPPGSRLGRDARGELTGVLHEWGAIQLVEDHMPEADNHTIQTLFRETISEAHQLGLTGILDQRLQNEGVKSFQAFRALQEAGELHLRIGVNVNEGMIGDIDKLRLSVEEAGDRLWIGNLKVFADGTMGARTAWMLDAYEGEPHNFGISVTPLERIRDLAILAQSHNLSLSVHAIGDRAVREVIDVMSEFPVRASPAEDAIPHRIEHVQLIHPDDISQLSKHRIYGSMQPVHLIYDWKIAERVWGKRSRYVYAFRSLLDANTDLAFGSDAPFAPLNPLLGIYAAATRQDDRGEPVSGWYPEEKLRVAEAVRGYTLGTARIAGKQKVQGSITPGKWADLIVLDQNIFEINPVEIATTQVIMTIFNGRIVFDRLS